MKLSLVKTGKVSCKCSCLHACSPSLEKRQIPILNVLQTTEIA